MIKANIARLPLTAARESVGNDQLRERVSSASRVLSGRWASVTISVNVVAPAQPIRRCFISQAEKVPPPRLPPLDVITPQEVVSLVSWLLSEAHRR